MASAYLGAALRHDLIWKPVENGPDRQPQTPKYLFVEVKIVLRHFPSQWINFSRPH
jgi:hypothetical protein